MFQFSVVTFFAITLHKLNAQKLIKLKKSIQNLYIALDLTSKIKLFYSTFFYFVRTTIVVIIVTKINFGVQVALIQLTFIANLVFLLEIQPYQDRYVGQQDLFNCSILLVKLVIQLGTSLLTNEPETRYYFGFFFDALIGMCFIANWLFLLFQSDFAFKLKKAYFQLKIIGIKKRMRQREAINKRIKEAKTRMIEECKILHQHAILEQIQADLRKESLEKQIIEEL